MEHSNFEDHKKKDVFKVPDGYFEDFNARLLKRIETESPQPKVRSIKPLFLYLSAAAAIIIAIGIPFIAQNNSTNSISKEELETYLMYNNSFGMNTDIQNELNSEDYIELESEIKLNDKEVKDYLLSHIEVEYYLNTDE